MRKKKKRLSYQDRKQIEAMMANKMRVVEIAGKIGVHRATIYSELKRSSVPYQADEAQKTV